jgi:hypothetical protein
MEVTGRLAERNLLVSRSDFSMTITLGDHDREFI